MKEIKLCNYCGYKLPDHEKRCIHRTEYKKMILIDRELIEWSLYAALVLQNICKIEELHGGEQSAKELSENLEAILK